jgi:hypothetical protein
VAAALHTLASLTLLAGLGGASAQVLEQALGGENLLLVAFLSVFVLAGSWIPLVNHACPRLGIDARSDLRVLLVALGMALPCAGLLSTSLLAGRPVADRLRP